MPRKARKLADKGIYIIHSKGIKGLNIFLSDDIKVHFIGLLQKCSVRYGIKIFFYTIFKNEYYVLIKDEENNLRYAFRYLNSIFTKYFNKLKKRHGEIFFDRYKSYVVQRQKIDSALIYLSHAISSRHKKTKDYKWSSYRFLNSYKDLPFFHGQILKNLLKEIKSDIDFENISQHDINESKKYFSNIKKIEKDNKDIMDYKKEKEIKEKRIPLKRLFSVVENTVERNRMILIAHTKYNYLLSEISDFLNLNPSTVSRIVKKEL